MFKKAFQFSANLHYFLIVNQNQYCTRDLFPLQPLELSSAALVTNYPSQRELCRWGGHSDGFSNNSTCPACNVLGFSSAMKGGDAWTHSNLIFTCQIWTIFYFTESEAISQNTCNGGGPPDLSRIGQFNRTFPSGLRFVLLMEKVNENKSLQKRSSCESAF